MGINMNDLPAHVRKQISEKDVQKYAIDSLKVKAARQPVRMNKTERNYAAALEKQRIAGKIKAWAHEPFNLRLADKTFYKPDFIVVTNERQIEVHEVKGRWMDDALVKIKVAAENHPWFTFRAVFHDGGYWKFRDFKSQKTGY